MSETNNIQMLIAELDKVILGEDVEDIEQGSSYVEYLRVWYKNAKTQPFWFYRISGSLMIVISVSLPIITTLKDWAWRDICISVMGLLLAGLSAFSAFFRWDQTAQGFYRTETSIDHLQATWQVARQRALSESDFEKAREELLKTAQWIVDETKMLDVRDTDEFFTRGKLPEGKKE